MAEYVINRMLIVLMCNPGVIAVKDPNKIPSRIASNNSINILENFYFICYYF